MNDKTDYGSNLEKPNNQMRIEQMQQTDVKTWVLRNVFWIYLWICHAFLPTMYKRPTFSTSSSFVICGLFDSTHSDRCEMTSHFWFWFAFPWWPMILSILFFRVLLAVCIFSQEKCVFRCFAHFKMKVPVFCLFIVEF